MASGSDGCFVIDPPRPIGPLSTSTANTRTPSMRYALAAGTDGAVVDVCADRACAQVLATAIGDSGRAVVTEALPPGVVFWRVRGRVGDLEGETASPFWELRIAPDSGIERPDGAWGVFPDVNGDGFADVVVGAPGFDGEYDDVFVYHGASTGPAAAPSAIVTHPDPSAAQVGFGQALAAIGDANGDGFGDVVIEAPCATYTAGLCEDAGYPRGTLYLYAGGPDGLGAAPISAITPPDAIRFVDNVAAAGDFDGDGYGDVAVGAACADPADTGACRAGLVLIYSGGPSGLSTEPLTLPNPSVEADLFGQQALEYTGDLDNDGRGEIAVSATCAPRYGPVGARECGVGRVYVFASGSSAPAFTAEGPPNTSGGFIFDHLGDSVAGAIDVDGDGFSDLMLAELASTFYGREIVYLGRPTLGSLSTQTLEGSADTRVTAAISLGDVRGGGFDDAVVASVAIVGGAAPRYQWFFAQGGSSGATLVPQPFETADGESGGWRRAGDIDGDGFEDVLLTLHCTRDPDAGGTQCGPGRVALYRGSATGIPAQPVLIWTGPNDNNGLFGVSAI